ncbi:CBS domain-containing protein [Afifella aestuarii]|uniref:CBS domain-containing protein n=1 Tax=Afifella aestuarii TaxID=1909496 RepID=UPI000FE34427|nr:CBS domain-containing protein [Afifella aestuarii]
MHVRQLLESKGNDVVTCRPQMSLHEVAVTLSEHRIGAVVVTEDAAIKGILSERDIVSAVAREGSGALSQPVANFMTARVRICRMHHTTDDLMEMMTNERFRHLPVEEDGKLVGIISIGDVVKRRIAEVQNEAEAIREYVTQG